MNAMFYGCYSLENLPDNLNKWNTSNLISMNSMFYKCYSLDYLPNLTEWDVSNVKDMANIFYGCNPSLYIDDNSKWNKENIALPKDMKSPDHKPTLDQVVDIIKGKNKK
jgi:surface protein